ncbi:MAG TPA: hypothetical protein DEP69_03570 [Acidimicrobiaceae bacterium]|nr:hypothetical protein [Acidimicrobiaceae bacterium]
MVSAVEIERGGPSYTIDTVLELRAAQARAVPARTVPARAVPARIVLIVGADAAAGIDTWHRARELRELVTLAVVARAGTAGPGTSYPAGPSPGWDAVGVALDPVDVSAADIRRMIAAAGRAAGRTGDLTGHGLDDVLAPAVIDYITRHGLYAAA